MWVWVENVRLQRVTKPACRHPQRDILLSEDGDLMPARRISCAALEDFKKKRGWARGWWRGFRAKTGDG